jgi:MoaA/NifB/PqqE/SkfB family radical SAM enzyme
MPQKTMDLFVYYVEVSGFCNLRCPSCPNGNSTGESAPASGYMPHELYTALLEKMRAESPGRETQLYLFNWGEPFLHPELPRFIETARGFGFQPHLSSNLAAPKNLREVILARPGSLRISLSGTSPETYAMTHPPGDVNRVLENARRVRSVLDEAGLDLPVHFLYHKYRHNLGEDFRRLKDLGAALGFPVFAVWAQFLPLEKLLDYYAGEVAPADRNVLDLMVLKPEDFRAVSLPHRPQHPDCPLRTGQMCLDVRGEVALCCAAYARENYLRGSFLDLPHRELQVQKYAHPLCARCRAQGCDLTYLYGGREELDALACSRI